MRRKVYIAVLAVAVLCLAASVANAVPLSNNLAGYYKFGYFDGNTYAAKAEMGIGAIKVHVLSDMRTLHLGIIVGDKIYFNDRDNQPSWGVLTQIDEDTALITSHDADTGETKEFTVIRITEEEANRITEENEVSELNSACAHNLKVLGLLLHRFAKDHNDEMPYSLAELYPDYTTDKSIFVCPARGGEFHDFDSDYEYIPGFRIGAPNPDQEPLIIENLGNHTAPNNFHNILYLDGHVSAERD